MAQSITEAGRIIEPIQVRRAGDRYEIVDGEVHWLAATQLKMDIVPIKVVSMDDEEAAYTSLISQMERKTLSPD